MEGLCHQVVRRTNNLEVPVVSDTRIQVILGIINCIFFGVGVIIAGFLNKSTPDVIIGILQLVIPFIGWFWAVVWGALMILNRKYTGLG
mmetsp:Transcript_473/g.553  ORF Transcript_473/g.553 Transcript_473/m.553 type:complete len:89 (+) Transcript_473:138-404(+)